MNYEFNNKDTSSNYAWNNAMILYKIQEILEDKNIDDLEFTKGNQKHLEAQLGKSISSESIS
ncbi:MULTISPECIES: hypothetical protein [unclassified Clostridioides]|uniref:hypothetical protein n=1 Tax=unclassified Clostridioides TaxID=2635829 RepID=UPI001D1104A6|nr:hypothetical protein [Clostridioides sp. ES-S-0049-03]MCC0676367.1 hypothetical protein [Clostridioides sp. ES-W-0018-02]MCC0702843.1 hypothetical protein [Clostridioides sp. ES-S-0049-02]MCC0711432.1 hypothetical protein [Clostridioides sp. ES-W-0017-02]